MTLHEITLTNGPLQFSALANHPSIAVFDESRTWTRVVFCIHGWPDNKDTYRELIPILEQGFAGEHVLIIAPTLRGYEPSSQPRTGGDEQYRLGLIAEDVAAWIRQVVPEPKSKTPVHLLGHDWGASAAYKTASKFPDLVSSMAALAIPYMMNMTMLEMLWAGPALLINGSHFIVTQFSWLYKSRLIDPEQKYVNGRYTAWSPSWKRTAEDMKSITKTMLLPGVADATTAYYRCMFRFPRDMKWVIAFDKVPTLIIGATEDAMPAAVYDLQASKFAGEPNVKVQMISNAGHFVQREQPVKVGEAVAEWFKKHPGPSKL